MDGLACNFSVNKASYFKYIIHNYATRFGGFFILIDDDSGILSASRRIGGNRDGKVDINGVVGAKDARSSVYCNPIGNHSAITTSGEVNIIIFAGDAVG